MEQTNLILSILASIVAIISAVYSYNTLSYVKKNISIKGGDKSMNSIGNKNKLTQYNKK